MAAHAAAATTADRTIVLMTCAAESPNAGVSHVTRMAALRTAASSRPNQMASARKSIGNLRYAQLGQATRPHAGCEIPGNSPRSDGRPWRASQPPRTFGAGAAVGNGRALAGTALLDPATDDPYYGESDPPPKRFWKS